MNKYLLVFNLFFSFLVNFTEAAPTIQQQAVDYLRPKLNSERIEYFFGNYGVDQLQIESPLFPFSRISNLHSIQQDKKIMRTLAIVDFFQPMHADLCAVHHTILTGKSIGAALQA
jgi:hypothetical protein